MVPVNVKYNMRILATKNRGITVYLENMEEEERERKKTPTQWINLDKWTSPLKSYVHY